jgi:hypothetical protein
MENGEGRRIYAVLIYFSFQKDTSSERDETVQ